MAAYDADAALSWQFGNYDDGRYYVEAASWTGEWTVLAGSGAEISRIDVDGRLAWTWPGDDDSAPAIAVGPDGRTYVVATNLRRPDVLFALSPDGELESVVELEDDGTNAISIAWSEGRVFLGVGDVPGHVECWDQPGG